MDGREDKNPWMKWYWSDFESDIGLRACSYAAQGLWIRMLSVMARSKKKGYLLDGDKQMSSKILAQLFGGTETDVECLIAELFEHGVPSKGIDGIIFNRRMARESEISQARAEAGKVGGLVRAHGKQRASKILARPKQDVEANGQALSASASVSASNSNSNTIEYIVNYFNQVTGQKIRHGSKYIDSLISGRLKDGFTLDDFKKVIDKKYAQWKDDPKMSSFIRPSTLFAPSHFEDYLNEMAPHEETMEEFKKRTDEATYGPGGKK